MSLGSVWRAVVMAACFLLVAGTSVTSATVSHVQRAPGSEDLLLHATTFVAFSPNGDHRRDHAAIRFRLARAARVRMEVTNPRGVVLRRVVLGRLAGGRHSWSWDGRDASGSRVRDGLFVVTTAAVAGPLSQTRRTWTRIDTEIGGELTTTRPTVHPRASAVRDHVQLVWLADRWSADGRDLGGEVVARAEMSIWDAGGHVVWGRVLREQYTPVFDWYARRPGGAALPPGRYVARLVVTDGAGNSERTRTVLRVSGRQLAEEVWSATVPAAAADAADWYAGDPGCLGCYDICPPTASNRFVGGLSFVECTDYRAGWRRLAHFGIAVPFDAAPTDTYRVSATGGPTTPGSTDVGWLDGLPLGPGDASATMPWTAVDLTEEPYLPTRVHPARWQFATLGTDAYDVATFTVEYRHYVPVPGSGPGAGPEHQPPTNARMVRSSP